jgi:co-chaperonin GroES (HSP10)
MQPLFNRVYIRRIAASEEVKNGLIIHPESDKLDEFLKGEIVAKGLDCTDDIQVGDVVGFRKNVGKEISIEFDKLLMVRETEIDFIW